MDPITARRVLRIFPDAPLTADLVERAYSTESAARHPSLYPDVEQRAQAEDWASELASARATLLSGVGRPVWLGAPVEPVAPPAALAPNALAYGPPSAQTRVPDPAAPGGPTQPRPRTRLRWPAVTGIVAGAVVLVALIVVAVIGAAGLVTTAVTDARQEFEQSSVERYQSGETGFAFPAALEYYSDGRYADLCAASLSSGCWQAALFTEADCAHLQVLIAYTDDAEAWTGDLEETIEIDDVMAYEATPVVYGNDAYAYGWPQQVTCLDAPTT